MHMSDSWQDYEVFDDNWDDDKNSSWEQDLIVIRDSDSHAYKEFNEAIIKKYRESFLKKASEDLYWKIRRLLSELQNNAAVTNPIALIDYELKKAHKSLEELQDELLRLEVGYFDLLSIDKNGPLYQVISGDDSVKPYRFMIKREHDANVGRKNDMLRALTTKWYADELEKIQRSKAKSKRVIIEKLTDTIKRLTGQEELSKKEKRDRTIAEEADKLYDEYPPKRGHPSEGLKYKLAKKYEVSEAIVQRAVKEYSKYT